MTILNLDYPKNWMEASFLIRNIEKELDNIKKEKNQNAKYIKLQKLLKAVEVILYDLDSAITLNKENNKNLQLAKNTLISWINKEHFFKKTITNL